MNRSKGAVLSIAIFIIISILSGCTGQSTTPENSLSNSEIIGLIYDAVGENLVDEEQLTDVSLEGRTIQVHFQMDERSLLNYTAEAMAEHNSMIITFSIVGQEELDPYWDEIVIEFTGYGEVSFTKDDLAEYGQYIGTPPLDFNQNEVPENAMTNSKIIELVYDSMEDSIGDSGYVTDVLFTDQTITIISEIPVDGLGEGVSAEDFAEFLCRAATYSILNSEKLDRYWNKIVIDFTGFGTVSFSREALTEEDQYFEIPPIDFGQ